MYELLKVTKHFHEKFKLQLTNIGFEILGSGNLRFIHVLNMKLQFANGNDEIVVVVC